jgi:hypothetical protein
MAPPKFDDLWKKAKDVLEEDYSTNGVGFKGKMKTNFAGLSNFTGEDKKEGGTLTTDIKMKFGEACATPAKISWKFPEPLIKGLAFDKFELDPAGKLKLESSYKADDLVKGVKVECKSDLKGLGGLQIGATYTGIQNVFIKAQVNATDPAKYEAEATSSPIADVTLGFKSTAASQLDLCATYATGPAFFAVTTKDLLTKQSFTGFGYYKASDNLTVAASYGNDGSYEAGLQINVAKGTLFKGKCTQKGKGGSVSASAKMDLAKGVSLTAGGNVPMEGNSWTYGLQFNAE